MRLFLVFCGLIAVPALCSAGVTTSVLPLLPAATTRVDSIVAPTTDPERKAQLAEFGQTEVSGLKQWQRQKSARVAVYSNMILPGLGQVYNGRRLKAVTVVGLMTYYLGRAWIEKKNEVRRTIQRDQFEPGTPEYEFEDLFVEFHRENKKDHIWWSGAVYLIAMLDAFVDAHLYDVRAVDPAVIKGTANQHYVGFSYEF